MIASPTIPKGNRMIVLAVGYSKDQHLVITHDYNGAYGVYIFHGDDQYLDTGVYIVEEYSDTPVGRFVFTTNFGKVVLPDVGSDDGSDYIYDNNFIGRLAAHCSNIKWEIIYRDSIGQHKFLTELNQIFTIDTSLPDDCAL